MTKKKTAERFKIGDKAILSMPVRVKSVDTENFTMTMVASTQEQDRHGDVVIQSGWNLDRYNENPVILNSHNYQDATEVIAKATRTEIKGKGKKARLEQDWQFAVKENPKAQIIFDLYAGGYLHASSVGFIPTKFAKDAQGNEDWYTIQEAELLEVSAVSVPANAYALAKSKGLMLDDEQGNPIIRIETIDDDEEDEQDDATEEEEEIEAEEDEKCMVVCGRCKKELGHVPAAFAKFVQHPLCTECSGIVAEEGKTIVEETTEINTQEETRDSYQALAIKAIRNIQSEQKRQLIRAHGIIQSILTGKEMPKGANQEVQQQIRNRRVNQAIRSLIKAK